MTTGNDQSQPPEPRRIDERAILKRLRPRLRRGRPLWFAWPIYHGHADALIWWDECPMRLSEDERMVLQLLLHIRTMRMLGRNDGEYVVEDTRFWDMAQSVIPRWVGFAPSRLKRTPYRVNLYETSQRQFEKDFLAALDDEAANG